MQNHLAKLHKTFKTAKFEFSALSKEYQMHCSYVCNKFDKLRSFKYIINRNGHTRPGLL